MVLVQYVSGVLLRPVLLRPDDLDWKAGKNLFRWPFNLEAEAYLVLHYYISQ